jgi:hypothetical protein
MKCNVGYKAAIKTIGQHRVDLVIALVPETQEIVVDHEEIKSCSMTMG